VSARAEFVLVDGHGGVSIRAAQDIPEDDQLERDLPIQTGRPIERDFEQAAAFELLKRAEQKPFAADIRKRLVKRSGEGIVCGA
jgi:hypothetical protein